MESRNHHILYRFLLPYLAFLTIPIAVGIATYIQAAQVLKMEIMNTRRLMLEGVADVVEQQAREIRAMTEQIASDSILRSFQAVRKPFEGPNTYQVRRAIDHLFDYKITNDLVLNYFITFERSNLVLGPGFCASVEEFDRFVLEFPDQRCTITSLTTGFSYGRVSPKKTAIYEGKPYEVLLYLRSCGYPQFSSSTVVVLLANEVITRHLDRIRTDPGSWAAVLDDVGQILTSVGPIPSDLREYGTSLNRMSTDHGRKAGFLVTSVYASVTGWTFIAGHPEKAVWADVDVIRRNSLQIVAFAVLCGLVASLLVASRTARPVEALSALVLSGETPDGEFFTGLEDRLRSILADRKRLSQAVEAQRPIIRSTLMAQLFHGRLNRPEFLFLSRQAGVGWNASGYLAGALVIFHSGDDGEDVLGLEREEIRLIVAKIVEDRFHAPSTALALEQGHFGLLITLSESDLPVYRSVVEGFASMVRSLIHEQYHSNVALLFGGIRDTPLEIGNSFREAADLISRTYPGSPTLFWEETDQLAKTAYYFPEGTETKIMNAVRAGNAAMAEEMIREILDVNNKAQQVLDERMLRVFWYELLGMAAKLCSDTGVESERMEELLNVIQQSIQLPYYDLGDLVVAVIRDICLTVEGRKRSHNRRMMDAIISYIDQHIGESDLSLVMAAAQFNLSEAYFSRFFKEQSGQNFIDYIEEVRMERARKLLSTSELPIKHIALEVGYRSVNTFCKAFKRHNSCSAGEYRAYSNI